MKINYHNNTNENIDEYINIINKAFINEKLDKSIEIIFINNDEMKNMNKYYRNIDSSTDVLSFPNDLDEINSYGDIFINVKYIKTQAKKYKHSPLREAAFLAVHGYLHLIGYDHDTLENEKEMFEKQEKILNLANIKRE